VRIVPPKPAPRTKIRQQPETEAAIGNIRDSVN
jgi:hypothetical protein